MTQQDITEAAAAPDPAAAAAAPEPCSSLSGAITDITAALGDVKAESAQNPAFVSSAWHHLVELLEQHLPALPAWIEAAVKDAITRQA